MVIKVVAFDVYGTILAYNKISRDLNHPPRKGLELFLDECERRRISAVTCSDVKIPMVKQDLSIVFLKFPERRLSIERFSNFFCLNQIWGKDYSLITEWYDIEPSELMVFDDVFENIEYAKRLGCYGILCPQYDSEIEDEFDFSTQKIP